METVNNLSDPQSYVFESNSAGNAENRTSSVSNRSLRSAYRCPFYFPVQNDFLGADRMIPGCSIFSSCSIDARGQSFGLIQIDDDSKNNVASCPLQNCEAAYTVGNRALLITPTNPQPRADGCIPESTGWSIWVSTTATFQFPSGGLYLSCQSGRNGLVDTAHLWMNSDAFFCQQLKTYCESYTNEERVCSQTIGLDYNGGSIA
jgi:hypothetical protein